MTTTAPPVPPAPPRPRAPAAAPRKRRRWRPSRRAVRVATPFVLILAVFLASAVMRWMDQLDPSDPAYLSPVSTEQAGSKALANLLAARGVTVERVTDSRAAMAAIRDGNATLFVPAPGYAPPAFVSKLRQTAAQDIPIVLVAPSDYTLIMAGMPVRLADTRWAPATVEPACDLPEAVAAGAATARLRQYRPLSLAPRHTCYDGGLLSFRIATGGRIDVIGAAEPFTNDRLGDAGNAALALNLLGAREKVVWLDRHEPEREPPPSPSQTDDDEVEIDEFDDDSAADDEEGTAWPLLSALPPWMVALLVQLLLAGVLCVLWQSRRLGTPVAEPLPVVVRSAETVEGRARLYQRARARGQALAALRDGALRRLTAATDLPADAPSDAVVTTLAARAGWPPQRVHDILYGPEPPDDAALQHAVAALDQLVSAVVGPAATGGAAQTATPTAPAPGAPSGKDISR